MAMNDNSVIPERYRGPVKAMLTAALDVYVERYTRNLRAQCGNEIANDLGGMLRTSSARTIELAETPANFREVADILDVRPQIDQALAMIYARFNGPQANQASRVPVRERTL